MYLPDPPPLDMLADRYEEETTRAVEFLLQKGMRFIDVGAHVGYYTLLAARCVGSSGTVYAFEPEPRNFRLLQRNVELNSYPNVITVRKAATDFTGTAKLYVSFAESSWHSLNESNDVGSQVVEVETTTLDHFLYTQRWPAIDLVKIDAEGAESAIVTGMHGVMERNPSLRIIFEFYPDGLRAGGVQPEKLLKQLKRLGFHLSLLTGAPVRAIEHLADSLSTRRSNESMNLLAMRD
jgi:FkbM family methyltransferase